MAALTGPGAWRIIAGPYEVWHGDEAEHGAEWVWIVTRGRDVQAVRVVVPAHAWRARVDPRAPKAMRDTIASRGATVVLEAIRAEDPPARIDVGPARAGAEAGAPAP